MIRKDCYDQRAWDSSELNAYASSTIDDWANNTYLALFSQNVQLKIGTTSFSVTRGNGSSVVDTLQRAIFLLSLTEFGFTRAYAQTEGSALGIADALKIAKLSGDTVVQWTRTPYTNSTDNAWFVRSDGTPNAGFVTERQYASRPCFTLPSTTKINKNGQVIE